MLTMKFRCPECGGSLTKHADDALICSACGESVPLKGGIADFVRGRFDTTLDVAAYDKEHGIDDREASRFFEQVRLMAGDRWPVSLGSVIEVGCGTGLFSRALLATGEARDATLTDVSIGMLEACRSHLERLGLLAGRNVTFATYSSNESCIRDAVFDTFAGTSVLHHILDVRSFLADVHRGLKPGGHAFFIEPGRRYHRALAQSLADIVVLLQAREGGIPEGLRPLLNWLAQQRRSYLNRADEIFLAGVEDKHQFLPEEFIELAGGLGFEAAEAIPFDVDRTGERTVRLLCRALGVAGPVRDAVAAMMPTVGSRFMGLLGPTDWAPSFLLWLTKPRGPKVRAFHPLAGRASLSERPRDQQNSGNPATVQPPLPPAWRDIAGITPRWSITVAPRAGAKGAELAIDGWYISNVDVASLRVTFDGVVRTTPVWLPRPDVREAINPRGRYAAWNALCCGIADHLSFENTGFPGDEHCLRLELVLSGGAVLPLPGADRIRLGETATFRG